MPYFDPKNADTWSLQEAQTERERQLRQAEALRTANPYAPQEQQQGGGLDAGTLMDAYKMYNAGGAGGMGGSSAPTAGSMSGLGPAAQSSTLGGQGAVGGLSSAPGPAQMTSILNGGSAAPTASAPASSAGGMSAGAMAGWAALAAAIIANESKQRGDGNRGNSGWEHAGDIASGKVLERDAERYLAHNKAGGAAKRALMMSTPSGIVRNTKDLFKWGKGLFD